MRLCIAGVGGFAHPDEIEAALTERQIQDYADHWAAEPWGTPADDQRTAQITWAAFQATSKKRIDIRQFVPQWGGTPGVRPLSYLDRAKLAYAAADPTRHRNQTG